MSNTRESVETVEQELARLRNENAALSEKLADVPSKGPKLSVTPKGTIRVPGIGMFGLCLYQEQWTRLFSYLGVDMPASMAEFIAENKSKLSVKAEGHVSQFQAEFDKRKAAHKAARNKSRKA